MLFHSDPVLLTAVHSTRCSLTPGLKYYYVFGDNSSSTWSQEFSFTAAPLPGPSATTRVVVYGGEIFVHMCSVCRHFSSKANQANEAPYACGNRAYLMHFFHFSHFNSAV